jgi:hypothetical protein
MAAKEIETEARAEAVMVVAAMAEEATAERVKVVEKAVAKEAVVRRWRQERRRKWRWK